MQPQRPRSLTKLLAAAEVAVQRATDELASEPTANAKYMARRACQLRHETRNLEELRTLAALGAAGRSALSRKDEQGGMCIVS